MNPLLQDLNLTAGTTYMIAATTFESGLEIPLPLGFFVYGEAVSIGASATSAVPEVSGHLALLALGSAGVLTRRRLKGQA